MRKRKRGAHKRGVHRPSVHYKKQFNKIDLSSSEKITYALLALIIIFLGFYAIKNYTQTSVGKAYEIAFKGQELPEGIEVYLSTNTPERISLKVDNIVKNAYFEFTGKGSDITINIDDNIIFTSTGSFTDEAPLIDSFDAASLINNYCLEYPCTVPVLITSKSDGSLTLTSVDIEVEELVEEEIVEEVELVEEVIEGDVWRVGTATKKLELSENLKIGSNRETIRNITTFIDDSELIALARGTASNTKGDAPYNQFLYLLGPGANIDTGYVIITEDDNQVTADFLYLRAGDEIGRYLLEFTTALESDVDDSSGIQTSTGLYLTDFEDVELTMFGKSYTIVQARRTSSAGNNIKLILMGEAEKDTLLDGTTKTYDIGGTPYEVTVTLIDQDSAKFTINDEPTEDLHEGETDTLFDGIIIAVTDILYQDYAGGVHSVTFFLGTQKIELEDNYIKDVAPTNNLIVNDQIIDNSYAIIEGTDDNIIFKLDRIHVNMTADDDFYVPAGGKLSENPGLDQPEVLFAQNWDIKYDGVTYKNGEEIKIATSGDKKYNLMFIDGDENQVILPLIEAVEPSKIAFGEIDKALINQEDKKISKNDYFIVTTEEKEDGRRESFGIQYEGADMLSADNPQIKFKNLGDEETIEEGISADIITKITIDGEELTVAELVNLDGFRVYNASSTKSDDFKIYFDLNGDGNIGENIVGINTPFGASIEIINNTDNTATITLDTPHTDDYDNLKPSSFIFELSADEDGLVQIKKSEDMLHNFFSPEEDELIQYAYSSYGTIAMLDISEDEPEEVMFSYPENQIVPKVFIIAKEAEIPEEEPKEECETSLDCPIYHKCEDGGCVSFCEDEAAKEETEVEDKETKSMQSLAQELNRLGYDVVGEAEIPDYSVKKVRDEIIVSSESQVHVFDQEFDSFVLFDSKGEKITVQKRQDTIEYQKSRPSHIIEFKEKPLLAFKSEIEKELGVKPEIKKQPKNIKERIENRLNRHKQRLEEAKVSAIQEMLQVNPEIESKIMNRYKNVFNGISVDISNKDASKIKSLPSIKNVFINEEVHAVLEESVNQISADEVWKLLDEQGKPITGEGITIGVIDTGVDYTHPDLGGSAIIEREFDKITEEPLDLWSVPDTDQTLVMNNNRIAYPSGNKIYIHSFESDSTEEIGLFSEDLEPIKIALKDNILAYFAYDQTAISLYFYDLETKINTEIKTMYTVIGSLSIADGKIVYGADASEKDETLYKNILVYDILSEEEYAVEEESIFIYMPLASGNLIAYSIPGDICYDKAVVYDLVSNEKKDIFPPDIGPILDFKDDKILYAACSKTDFDSSWETYYLYDINTDEFTKLKYEKSEEGIEAKETNIKSWLEVSSAISKGSIEENLIYFSKNVNADRIIAYDQNQDRYVQINLGKNSYALDAEGNEVCFVSLDSNVYCHDYNPEEDYEVPEIFFNDKVIGGYDFVNDDNDPMDDQGHGTHVAATAAGNGILKGVAPDAKIVAYKVLDSWGGGDFDGVIEAIERSIDPNQDENFEDHLDVISLSLGGPGDPDDPISTAIDNAVDAGVVAVIAAGNSGPNPETIGSPGTARKAITVGAVDKCDLLADFSSRGPVFWDHGTLLKPDLTAPGVDICAAQWGDAWSSSQCLDTEHVAMSGTSMAAPHVSGVAALLLQANPEWTPDMIKSSLMTTSLDLGIDTTQQGTGRINALNANEVDITTQPQSISFEFKSEDLIHTENIVINNLLEEEITVSLGISELSDKEGNKYDFASLSINELTIAPSSTENFDFIVNIPEDVEGLFTGKILIINNREYVIPFFFERTSRLTVEAIGIDNELSPDFYIHKDLSPLKSAINGNFGGDFTGNKYTFKVSPGTYTAYAIEQKSNFDYILMDTVEVFPGSETQLELKLEDAKKFNVKAESLQGVPLSLYQWTLGFNTYDDENIQSVNYQDQAFGNKSVYLSKKPENEFDTDILLYYQGVPARAEDLE